MHHNHSEEFLGIDVGSVNIGVARGSSGARIAQPLKTLAADKAVDELAELASNSGADGLVVGLPRSLNGDDTAQTTAVREWVKAVQSKIQLPFYWQDEALTSQKALKIKPKKTGSVDEHALAATIILQDFLDTPKEEWVRC